TRREWLASHRSSHRPPQSTGQVEPSVLRCCRASGACAPTRRGKATPIRSAAPRDWDQVALIACLRWFVRRSGSYGLAEYDQVLPSAGLLSQRTVHEEAHELGRS